jgi:hypothetical protein
MGKPILPQQSLKVRPRILVFSRNYLIPDFHDNFDPLLDDYEIDYLTDQYCKLGTKDTRKSFYAQLNQGNHCSELDSKTELDVIARCRLLRNLDRDQANRMAHAMASVICGVLDELKPAIVATHLVDEYIIHLFSILASRRGIRFIAFCGSYFPGYAFFVQGANGSALPFRSPSDEEVDNTLQAVSPTDFRQNYRQLNQYSVSQHTKLMLRYFAKKLVFFCKKFIEDDPWGMHYIIVPFCADRRHFSDFPLQTNFDLEWQKSLQKMRKDYPDKAVIYLPLSYSPECTTDYWIENRSIIDYEKKVVEIVRSLASECIVLLKEHAHMMGARNSSLYKTLKSIDSVISVYPAALGNEVLLSSDAVVLGSGSVGVEAFIRDKPVFSYCNSSYWFPYTKAEYLNLDEVTNWPNQIKGSLPNFSAASHEDKRQFIRNCLKSTARIKPGGRRWVLVQPNDLKLLLDAIAADPNVKYTRELLPSSPSK